MGKQIRMVIIFSLGMVLIASGVLNGQTFDVERRTRVYKNIDGTGLEMVIYEPQMSVDISLPAIVFFFGGGWVSGQPDQIGRASCRERVCVGV